MAVPMKAATSQAALPGVALAATAPAAAPHAGVVPASCQPPGRPSDAPLPDDASSVAMDTPASLRESVKALRRQQPVTRLARNRPRTFPECKDFRVCWWRTSFFWMDYWRKKIRKTEILKINSVQQINTQPKIQILKSNKINALLTNVNMLITNVNVLLRNIKKLKYCWIYK
ncbi:PREDICTED: uncharacterized protein LOC108446175 isoform X2 [Corvus brachyrhynchos]|uniref:uncharacterized protein LOC108446175 isoform X2 n=1 Tax=Corvus brachyrhynchos TaxID=85066 RepID=UPI0008165B3F|nr:PREDICTED: uncharacterized protein LOC108446175 isoform X2 [Corvus brachyrhynchos]